MTPNSLSPLLFGDYHLDLINRELRHQDQVVYLEPKVMELLFALALTPNKLVDRDHLVQTLWPNIVVNDDTLARTVSKLRKALGDDAKTPRWLKTIPKRGYLLAPDQTAEPREEATPHQDNRDYPQLYRLAGVIFALLAIALFSWHFVTEANTDAKEFDATLERAADYYFQFSREDNATAMLLYERLLTQQSNHALANAGLANALIQTAIRYPPIEHNPEFKSLGQAIQNGHLKQRNVKSILQKAEYYAQRAVELAPEQAETHKALGFVHSAQLRFEEALGEYHIALTLDPNAWGVLINIGDVLELSGQLEHALPYFISAYHAMENVYATQSARVHPWYAELGIVIARRYLQNDNVYEAKRWYQKVLATTPNHEEALKELITLYKQMNDTHGLRELCASLSAPLRGSSCTTL